MAVSVKDEIALLKQQEQEIAELNQGVLLGRIEITAKGMVLMMKKLTESFDEILEDRKNDERVDLLSDYLVSVLNGIKGYFEKLNLKQEIVFDTSSIVALAKPMTALAEKVSAQITAQNELVKKLLNKPEAPEKEDKVLKDLLSMVIKNNELVVSHIKQMADMMKAKEADENEDEDEESELTEIRIERDRNSQLIQKLIPVYKNKN